MDRNLIQPVIDRYASVLYRAAFTLLQNRQDAEDALQETLLRFITRAPDFHDEEHKKAWLIRVAINVSKDMLRYRNRHDYLPLDEFSETEMNSEQYGILEEVMVLPLIYREVILLYYIEDYPVRKISEILTVPESTVKKRLQYAREKLRIACEEQTTADPPLKGSDSDA
ncbi:MAG: RNA polymerase sigma factor [Ruminococcaceae bacterium]|nr:RNA polymerase sigma factor [Oscillospiraceae bacterium]